MRRREAKVKTMTREGVSAPPRRRPLEIARAEERKRKERVGQLGFVKNEGGGV